ncbi:LPXTG-motif cell wall-anchored protein [Marmoricola sp. URHA0025 HA25]
MKLHALIAAALLTVMAALGLAAPASAAGNQLQVSADGVTWGASLPTPLFSPSSRWIPGDSETRSFYVRNHTGQDAVLDVIMLPAQFGDLMTSGALTVSAQVDGGTWVSATSADNSHFLITNASVPGKAVRKINVRIAFAASAGNATQDREVGLAFDVSLTQGRAIVLAPHAGNGGPKHHPGSLPNTGNDVSPSTIALAALMCLLGAALALVGQRTSNHKKKEDSHA